MVAPPYQTTFDASSQSGQTWASVVAGRGGDDGGFLSSGKGFETSYQSLAGKSESFVAGGADDIGLSDSDPSISPMIECVADDSVSPESVSTISKVVSYETVEEEGIEKDGVGKFENLSVDVKEKEVVDDEKLVFPYEIEKEEIGEKESEDEVKSVEEADRSKKGLSYDKVKNVDDLESDDGIEEQRSFVSGKVDDDDKRYQVLVEEEIVNLTSAYIAEPDDLTAAYDGDFELTGKETLEAAKVEIGEKEESSIAVSVDAKVDSKPDVELQSNENIEVSEVNNADEGGDKISVSDIVSTCEFSSKDKEIDLESSGGESVVGVDMSDSNKETEEMIFGSYKAAGQFLEELEKASSGNEIHSDETSILSNQLDRIDGQVVTDSDEEVDTDDEGEEKTFDTAALAAFLKAVTGGSSHGGNLGSSLRHVQSAAPCPNRAMGGESESNLSEEEKQKLEKLQSMRVKYLRLVHRLGQSVEDSIASQVLYRLALLAGRHSGQSFSLDAAKKMVRESEAEGKEDLEFSLNILVLGKSGVGKSATINSILGDQKASVDAFGPSTSSVRKISGTVDDVKITIIDTPGLKSYAMDQSANSKMLSSVKKVVKNCPPDVVLYVDRLDAQNRGLNNMHLLRTITTSLGPSIWENAIVTLTHAASAPPDGPSGTPLSYDVFVAQCSHIVQQSIGQAVGDLRLMNPSLMNPVALVENHPLCRKNREGVKVLPNGQTWRPQLLLLCYSLKVLSEANSLLKPQEPLDHRKYFWSRVRSPPLPNLLSWLLQSRAHPKLPADQGGDNIDSDIEIDDVCDSEQEDGEDDEYNQLPPFKPLGKTQLDKLSKEHREAYFDEYHYRVKLLQKKQWREELRRMREMKKKGKKKVAESEYGYPEEEEAPPASPPGLLPDMVLPPSFDSDDSAYRYRSLEPTSQLLTRSVLDSQGWDHDCGYNRVIAERSLVIAKRFPAAVSVQVTKDKKEFNILLNSSVCAKHGDNGSTMAEFLIQGSDQLMYLIKGETKFKNFRKNKTTLGGLVTYMGGNIGHGIKLEDQILLGKRLVLVGNAGTSRSRGDSVYEANFEMRLRDADFPIGQNQSALGLSLTKSKADLTVAANLRFPVPIGRQTKLAVSASLDSKRTGHLTIGTNSSDQLLIAFVAILPIAICISYRRIMRSREN